MLLEDNRQRRLQCIDQFVDLQIVTSTKYNEKSHWRVVVATTRITLSTKVEIKLAYTCSLILYRNLRRNLTKKYVHTRQASTSGQTISTNAAVQSTITSQSLTVMCDVSAVNNNWIATNKHQHSVTQLRVNCLGLRFSDLCNTICCFKARSFSMATG